VKISYNEPKRRYEFVGGYDDRAIPKRAGFAWDRDAKLWWTDRAERALRLANIADSTAQALLDVEDKRRRETLEISRATDATIRVPSPPGCEYLGFQRAGIAFIDAVIRNSEKGGPSPVSSRGVLLADEMGL